MIEGSSFDSTTILSDLSLINAAARGDIELVKRCLADTDIDPTADDNEALDIATINGHADVIKILLADERIDPSVYSNLAIRRAIANGHTEIVKLLLADHRVNPDTFFDCPLAGAAKNGHTKIVKLLLADSRVSSAQIYYSVAEHLNVKEEIVKLLITAKQMNARNHKEAIRLAILTRNTKILMLILTHSGINPADPIKQAAADGNLKAILLLLKHPAVLKYVSDNFQDFIANHPEVQNALTSTHAKYNKAFRESFFSIIRKEFMATMPYAIAALHANEVPNDVIVHNIAAHLHPIFEFYKDSVTNKDENAKKSCDGIDLINYSRNLLPPIDKLPPQDDFIIQKITYDQPIEPGLENNTMDVEVKANNNNNVVNHNAAFLPLHHRKVTEQRKSVRQDDGVNEELLCRQTKKIRADSNEMDVVNIEQHVKPF